MWINKEELMKLCKKLIECDKVTSDLEGNDWKRPEYNKGYDRGYVDGLRRAIKLPSHKWEKWDNEIE